MILNRLHFFLKITLDNLNKTYPDTLFSTTIANVHNGADWFSPFIQKWFATQVNHYVAFIVLA